MDNLYKSSSAEILKTSDLSVTVIAHSEIIDKDNDLIIVKGFNHDYLMNESTHKARLWHMVGSEYDVGTIVKSESMNDRQVPYVVQDITFDDNKKGHATKAYVESEIYKSVSIGFKRVREQEVKRDDGITVYKAIKPFETSFVFADKGRNRNALIIKKAEDILGKDYREIYSFEQEIEMLKADLADFVINDEKYKAEIKELKQMLERANINNDKSAQERVLEIFKTIGKGSL